MRYLLPILLFLASCGSGGGGTSSPTPPTEPPGPGVVDLHASGATIVSDDPLDEIHHDELITATAAYTATPAATGTASARLVIVRDRDSATVLDQVVTFIIGDTIPSITTTPDALGWSMSGDAYTATWTIDSGTAFTESNESNNMSMQSFEIHPSRQGSYVGQSSDHADACTVAVSATDATIAIPALMVPWTATHINPAGLAVGATLAVGVDGSFRGENLDGGRQVYTGTHDAPSPLVVNLDYTYDIVGAIERDNTFIFTVVMRRHWTVALDLNSEWDPSTLIQDEERSLTFEGQLGSGG